MTVDAFCVDPKRIHEVWPLARPLIFSAADRTGLSNPEDTEYELMCGDQLLWVVWDGTLKAAVSTRLSNGVCTITACGGTDMKSWVKFFPMIEAYAKAEGCRLRISGRMGWARVLRPFGFKVKHVILERSV